MSAALADRYRIERALGAGGMATVYLAEDLKHHRKVAIKVLRAELSAMLGEERFLKEIELTASLQHPHILPLFDSGSAGGSLYYVMPFVEGETLRGRLDREQRLPITEAIRLATEVAGALDYAHREGVVHRDVKPENILLHDGHAQIADFGIALAVRTAGGERITATGMSLGTPQYMSPEQASGERDVDARTDVFALGAVVYEMLAGTPPHTGPTAQAIIARLLTERATALTVLRPDVPAPVAAAVARALSKVPGDRFATTADFSAALAAGSDVRRRPAMRWVLAAAGALAVVVAMGIGVRNRRTPAPMLPGTLVQLTRDAGLELDPALSPDGRSIAFAAGPVGSMRIFVRQISGGRTIAIAESLAVNQRWPQWSPDGATIVFHTGIAEGEDDPTTKPDELYVVPALGGTPRRVLADTASNFSPSWSHDGTRIVFGRGVGIAARGLYEVNVRGDTAPRRLVTASGGEIQGSLWAGRWSPDGSMLAYVSGNPRFGLGTSHLGNNAPASIWVLTLADGRTHRMTADSSLNVSPAWTPDGRTLLYVSNRDGGRDVFRIGVNRNGEPDGRPERVTTGIGASAIDLARDGRTLAYSVYTAYSHIWSVPISASGEASLADATQVTFGGEQVEGLALSADGRWLAYDSDRSGNGDIWRIATSGGQPVQLTTDPHGDYVQDWSPDGSEIAFHSFRTGQRQVFVTTRDGDGAAQVTTMRGESANPEFSPDGNSIAVEYFDGTSSQVLVTSRLRRGAAWSAPRTLTTRGGTDPSWSPDGQWIAYVSNGIRRMSPSGDDDQLIVPASAAPGGKPLFAYWSPDSRTLYYKSYDARNGSSIWSVPASGGAPRLLIRFGDPSKPSARREFATDGKRLYFTVAEPQSDVWLMTLREK